MNKDNGKETVYVTEYDDLKRHFATKEPHRAFATRLADILASGTLVRLADGHLLVPLGATLPEDGRGACPVCRKSLDESGCRLGAPYAACKSNGDTFLALSVRCTLALEKLPPIRVSETPEPSKAEAQPQETLP